MCGILGITQANKQIDLSRFSYLLNKLNHRGPDHQGQMISKCKRVAFGHTRLSIIDLSDNANQPFTLEDGNFAITFNGEIYNYQEIRRELTDDGYYFRTNSDTEVILASYMKWGEGCVLKFNGMFSFAIYDSGATKGVGASIFLARDRAGEKPFYYLCSDEGIIFASELKALPNSHKIDLNSLNHYLALGYIPHDLSLYDGIKKLPPAHVARYEIDSGILEIKPYWFLPTYNPDRVSNIEELAENVSELIEDSVRLRLQADVSVGVLLSGGLDSSLIAAAAARVSNGPIDAFTISVAGSSLDEANHSKKIAKYFGMHHHILELNKPSLDLLDNFSPFVDEPIADSSILPAWLVFGFARTRVKVALGGDGGDELFGGYSDYTTSISDASRLRVFPKNLLSIIANAAAYLPAGVRGRNRISSLKKGAYQQLIWGSPYFDVALRKRILSKRALEDIYEDIGNPEKFLLSLFISGSNPIDQMTRAHFGSILPDDFLFKIDRTSMAYGLEVRTPFLDHRLIEFAFSKIPAEWKCRPGQSRPLQRLIANKILPSEFDGNRKQGFSIPINEWLRADGEVGLLKRLEGLPDQISMDQVRSLVRGHMHGRANGGRIFALLMLAISVRNKV